MKRKTHQDCCDLSSGSLGPAALDVPYVESHSAPHDSGSHLMLTHLSHYHSNSGKIQHQDGQLHKMHIHYNYNIITHLDVNIFI